VAFVKKGTDWRFSKPWDAKADFGTVDGLVGKLFMAKMASIEAADGTADLKKYGSTSPRPSSRWAPDPRRPRLALGAKKAEGNLYARDLSRPMVFTIDASLLDDLKKKPEDLRKKEVFEFRAFSATSVSLTVGGKSADVRQAEGAGPEGSEHAARPGRVEADEAGRKGRGSRPSSPTC
jgi:hypothetical protein